MEGKSRQNNNEELNEPKSIGNNTIDDEWKLSKKQFKIQQFSTTHDFVFDEGNKPLTRNSAECSVVPA